MIIKLIKNEFTEVHSDVVKYRTIHDESLFIQTQTTETLINLEDWDYVYFMNDDGKTVDTILNTILER